MRQAFWTETDGALQQAVERFHLEAFDYSRSVQCDQFFANRTEPAAKRMHVYVALGSGIPGARLAPAAARASRRERWESFMRCTAFAAAAGPAALRVSVSAKISRLKH